MDELAAADVLASPFGTGTTSAIIVGASAALLLTLLAVAVVPSVRGLATELRGVRLEHGGMGRLLWGFSLSVLAAVSWGVGGVVTKYSTEHYAPRDIRAVAGDIGLANYASGAATVLVVALLSHFIHKARASRRSPALLGALPKAITVASLFKGANTYAFTAALGFVSAAAATITENLNIVWTALAVSLISRRALSLTWYAAAIVVFAGAALSLGAASPTFFSDISPVGLSLALLAGLAFSAYILTWNRVAGKDSYAPRRAMETGVFLGITTIVILLIHYTVGLAGPGSIRAPFSSITTSDLVIQLVNGMFNIGLTYFLMGEALRVLGAAGPVAAFLLSLGVSYSVLFTVLAQNVLLADAISSVQWLGVAIFTVGFALIRYKLSGADSSGSGPINHNDHQTIEDVVGG